MPGEFQGQRSHRPIKNWNDGKLQEFKDRKTYDTCNSSMKPRTATVTISKAEEKDLPELQPAPDAIGSKPMLFTTHTCAKCKAVKAMFDEQRFDYELIYADDDADKGAKGRAWGFVVKIKTLQG